MYFGKLAISGIIIPRGGYLNLNENADLAPNTTTTPAQVVPHRTVSSWVTETINIAISSRNVVIDRFPALLSMYFM